jgi:hypothetical protein
MVVVLHQVGCMSQDALRNVTVLTPSYSIICLIATLWITNMVKSEFADRWMIIAFSAIYPFYLVLTATIGLYGHARQVVKYSSWNPTART